MYTRQNARQIRERHYYNGVTVEMVEIREMLAAQVYVLDPESEPMHMTFPKYKILDRVKEVRAAHENKEQ
jgi:hypothetical protein